MKAVSIFANISMNMKKSRTCWWIIIVKISKQIKKHVKRYHKDTRAMQIQEKKSATYEIIKNPKNDRQKTNTNDNWKICEYS